MAKKKNKNSKVSADTFQKFLTLCVRLQPEQFVGLCKILCVNMMTNQIDEEKHHVPRPFEDIFSDVMDKFLLLDKKKRNQLLSLLYKVEQQNKIDKDGEADAAEN